MAGRALPTRLAAAEQADDQGEVEVEGEDAESEGIDVLADARHAAAVDVELELLLDPLKGGGSRAGQLGGDDP